MGTRLTKYPIASNPSKLAKEEILEARLSRVAPSNLTSTLRMALSQTLNRPRRAAYVKAMASVRFRLDHRLLAAPLLASIKTVKPVYTNNIGMLRMDGDTVTIARSFEGIVYCESNPFFRNDNFLFLFHCPCHSNYANQIATSFNID